MVVAPWVVVLAMMQSSGPMRALPQGIVMDVNWSLLWSFWKVAEGYVFGVLLPHDL